MPTTCGGTRTASPSAVRRAMNACTDDAAKSTSASAVATRARTEASGGGAVTVR